MHANTHLSHTHTYAQTTHTHTHTHTHIHTHTHTHTHLQGMHGYIHPYKYISELCTYIIHADMYMYMHVHVYVCMRVVVYMVSRYMLKHKGTLIHACLVLMYQTLCYLCTRYIVISCILTYIYIHDKIPRKSDNISTRFQEDLIM